MNLYWVPHTGSENHCETTKSLKICYLFNSNQEQVLSYQDLGHKQTETTHQQRVGRSESHGCWMFCLASGVAPTCLCSGWRRIFWAHAVTLKMMWC